MKKYFYQGLMMVPLLVFFLAVPFATVESAPVFITCDGTDCSFCNLVDLANVAIVWLFGIIFLIFAIMMLVAGFGLVTSGGNQAALDSAKSKFQNAIIGLIIVMAAWLLVDSIMRAVVGGGSVTDTSGNAVAVGNITGWGPWSEVQCQTQTVPETMPDLPEQIAPEGSGSYGVGGSGASSLAVLTQLQAAGVGDGGNVISYDGLRPVAIDGVIRLNDQCGCNIVITEATGGTHASGQYSHENGYKLDLRTRDNPDLLRFVESEFELVGKTSSKNEPIYKRDTPSGGYEKCIQHSTHLDCQFVPGAGS